MTGITQVISSVMMYVPLGYEVDCASWPGGKGKESIKITLAAKDGSEFSGTIIIEPSASPEAVQDAFVAMLEDSDWIVRRGSKATIVIFGPYGSSVKSIKIESMFWKKPGYRLILRKN